MASYPTLSSGTCTPYTEEPMDGNSRVTGTDGGYKKRRRVYTLVRKTFSFSHNGMSDSDKTTLASFYETYIQDTSFLWPDKEGTSRTVFFSKKPSFKYAKGRWSVDIQIEEG